MSLLDAEHMTDPYRVLFERHPHPMWVFDRETHRFLAVNDAAVAHYGYTREEFLSMTIRDIRPREELPALEDKIRERPSGLDGARVWRHRKKDAALIDVEISSHEIGWEGRDARVVLALDVTERRLAHEALRESEERHRLLFEQSPIGIYRSSPTGELVMANPTMVKMLGYSSFEELAASKVEETGYDSDQERARFREILEREGEVVGFQTAWRRRDGGVVHVRENVRPVRDLEGRVLYYEGTVEDITDRIEAQAKVEAYSRELERSNRALEEFASVASHDLQEPLRKIQAFGERLAAAQAERFDERGRDYLARMQDAAARMQRLINDLLAYSRLATQGLAYVPVDLGDVARAVLSDLETAVLESGGSIEVEALPTVEADPLQMRQLLQNLVSNALKYRSGERAPRVRISSRRVGPGAVELRVEDNGIGFKPEYAERIFGLFQRLHGRSEYEGTGIGLALCRKIAERHGGTITAESTPGEGSTFVVALPLRQTRIGSQ